MSYDQWKTASPYDDEPDVIDELKRLAVECERESVQAPDSKQLLIECKEVMEWAAEFIEDNV